jgi:hypothetical protein
MEHDSNKASEPRTTGKTAKRILSVSLAAASLLVSATSALGSVAPATVANTQPVAEFSAPSTAGTLPAPLVLRHAISNQQLVAQHDSHSSHESHSSHSSHSSGY